MNQVYEDFLVHHGVKGQKWGVRRYQNQDGTLTEDGKKRQTLWQRATHQRKESIRNAALKENKNRQSTYEASKKQWDERAKQIESKKKEYDSVDSYRSDLAFSKSQAKQNRDRVEQWKRREKWLMNMKVDELSVRQVKKSTKLKISEYAYPSEFEKYK